MGKKKDKNKFMFTTDKISIRLLHLKSLEAIEPKDIVFVLQKKIKNVEITLENDVLEIESDTYFKFKKIRAIFDVLEDLVAVNDDETYKVEEVFF